MKVWKKNPVLEIAIVAGVLVVAAPVFGSAWTSHSDGHKCEIFQCDVWVGGCTASGSARVCTCKVNSAGEWEADCGCQAKDPSDGCTPENLEDCDDPVEG